MRIIAGANRGTRLEAPKGDHTRPTADRARETLFAVLDGGRIFREIGSPPVTGRRVLDAFAGTGAVGLEALSRGAAHTVFIEDDGAALVALERNVARCHREEQATVLRRDVLNPPPAGAPCDLVFLDPPYGRELPARALAALEKAGWIAADAVVVVQHHPKDRFDRPEGFATIDTRTVGAARFEILRPQPGSGTTG